ncbi:ATP-binding protein [Olivibacter sp. CPCC 100613]|uniref:ATP-binding protein n=1 Tax=Olivibacter sp. CPCC 100613 TaxID=3079931 RepID=UPI002FFA0F8E
MDNKVSINNHSVESAGITKSYKEAICELIWNGFDANASRVDIVFKSNSIDYVNELQIVDNGTGIHLATLHQTFGAFLDSVKRESVNRSSYVRGKKGKGRFSFIAFAQKAIWSTTFFDEQSDKMLDYDIMIDASNKDIYKDNNKRISKKNSTGTVVTLSNLFGVSGYSFDCSEFLNHLKSEFGWYLLLNRSKNFKLCINGCPIEYHDIIADNEVFHRIIADIQNVEFTFRITYIRWHDKIGDKFYCYFLNQAQKELFKQLTSFNNNAIGFYHSVYVESSFFDDFVPTDGDHTGRLFGANLNSSVFKVLVKELQHIIADKQKVFVRSKGADKLIDHFDRKGILPKFRSNKYDQEKRKDLMAVIKEIYCIQPKIFKGLNETQERTSVAFINLLLESDEREHILSILDDIVHLRREEREGLAILLKKTSLSRITRTISLIENRFATIGLLKKMVFDLKRFTTERDHIQHAIAENYWLFGEQFHLVTANENFEKLLSKYLCILDGGTIEKMDLTAIKDKEKNRRPDVFLCRQRSVPDALYQDEEMEENVMVELKRPSVIIGKQQLRQIEDYMDFVSRQDAFNSQTRQWKFFVVSNRVDSYILKQYEEFKNRGKRFLVKSWGNLEIFAMTWDDVFRIFYTRHKYLLDKLDFDKEVLQEELQLKGIVWAASEGKRLVV